MQAGSILSNKRHTLHEQDWEAPHPVRLFYEATSVTSFALLECNKNLHRDSACRRI
jgi:hypothetical protein